MAYSDRNHDRDRSMRQQDQFQRGPDDQFGESSYARSDHDDFRQMGERSDYDRDRYYREGEYDDYGRGNRSRDTMSESHRSERMGGYGRMPSTGSSKQHRDYGSSYRDNSRSQSSRRDEFSRSQGSRRDEYSRSQGSRRDEYSRSQGSRRDDYQPARGRGYDDYRGRGDEWESRGYESRADRGFFEKAGDEVASWFGDDDAERRRQMDNRGRGPANYERSNERLLEDACERLTHSGHVDASNINVTAENNEITLDGNVHSRRDKRAAEDCVHDISGVKHVQNNLRIADRDSHSDDKGNVT